MKLFFLGVLSLTYFMFAFFAPASSHRLQAEEKIVTFNWPTPQVVLVKEKWVRRGLEFKSQYLLDIQRYGSSGYRVQFKDYRFTMFEGRGIFPGHRHVFQGAAKIYLNTPTLNVTSSGKVSEMEKLEEYTWFILDYSNLFKAPESREFFDAQEELESRPMLRPYVEYYGKKYWRTWIDPWKDFKAQPGKPVTEKIKMELGGLEPATGTVTSKHLGPIRPGSPVIKVRNSYEFAGDDLARAMTFEISAYFKGNQLVTKLPDMKLFMDYEATIDTKTLRLVSMTTDKRVRWGDNKQIKENHEYTFKWNRDPKDPWAIK